MFKLLSILLLISMIGCSSTGIDRESQNVIIKEYYASVSSITQVQLSSEVKTGIAAGAGIGLIEKLDGNHEDMIAGSIAGALIGGLFTAIFEGGNTAYQYALNSPAEGDFILVQKAKISIESQCVKLIVAQQVSIISAPSHLCEIAD